MAPQLTNEKILDFDTIWKEADVNFSFLARRNAVPLKWILGGIDFVLSFVFFVLSASFFEYFSNESFNLSSWIPLLILSLLVIIFFPPLRLYSRHLVFSKRKHVAQLVKAFASSFLSFSFVVAAFALPVFAKNYGFTVLVLVLALLIITSRFIQFESGASFYLFKIFGISMIVVGALGILSEGGTPAILRQPELAMCGFLLAVVTIFAARLGGIHLLFNSTLKRHFRRQVAVIGSDEQGNQIVSYIIDRNAPFWVAGTIGEHCELKTKVRKHCLGMIQELPGIVGAHKIDELLIADQNIDKRTLVSILDFCMSNGIQVWFPPSYIEIIDRKLYIDNFCGLPMIKLCSPQRIWLVNKFKHSLDAIIGLPLFIFLLPLFGVIAAAIKINSEGPVFYKARAIGKTGREFAMYKFRSMRVNNDAGVHKDYVTKLIKGEIGKEGNDGKPLKITDDPRVTAVGNILRKFSLDELPQLINVIKGDMSLVGPRPCLPYEYEIYQDWYKKRASIRPGITGLWQVAGRSEVSFEDMILLDLYYLYNRSLWMDLNILIETAFVLLEKRGAY